jgi:hypothetical protein
LKNIYHRLGKIPLKVRIGRVDFCIFHTQNFELLNCIVEVQGCTQAFEFLVHILINFMKTTWYLKYCYHSNKKEYITFSKYLKAHKSDLNVYPVDLSFMKNKIPIKIKSCHFICSAIWGHNYVLRCEYPVLGKWQTCPMPSLEKIKYSCRSKSGTGKDWIETRIWVVMFL